MRIRKRQVSLLFPVTLPDPNLISRSPVLVQLNAASATTTTSPKPSCTRALATAPVHLSDPPAGLSDHPRGPIEKPTHRFNDISGEGAANRRLHMKQEYLVEDGGGGGQKGNDSRKEDPSCSERPSKIFSPSSPSSLKQDGRWCEAEKAFPPKKRRASLESATRPNNNDNSNTKKKKTVKRMKTKMNKKCSAHDDDSDNNEDDQEEEEEKVVITKKRVRGGAIMEGSRCSRVNGRGWRCCQQTLVGYSLCEHHLGKGRLRSMTSVRNRSVATTTQSSALKNNNVQDHMPLSESSSSYTEKKTKCSGSESEEENDDEKKPLIVTKKRMKLGMVKARSMSSLLGQTNQP